jgi:S-methylmethionine-dependent homocysteine/selenocysteine methylase
VNPVEHLSRRLAAGEVVVIDGATGTELEARGVPMDEAAWCGVANLEFADVVREVHEDYIRAGAAVVIANTFATGRSRLEQAGLEDRVEEANRRAVSAALEARERAGRPEVVVAGSLSRAVAFGIDGTPQRGGRSRLLELFGEQADILAEAGAELLALEMIGGADHGEPALEAARATGLPVWLGLSAQRSSDGGLVGWGDAGVAFHEVVRELASPDLAAVLVMHTDVADVDEALEAVFRHWHGVVGVYPHVGDFAPPSWRFNESFTTDVLVRHARRWADRGVRIVGGCCGLGPAYIRALGAELG